jgi:hypothetical protein
MQQVPPRPTPLCDEIHKKMSRLFRQRLYLYEHNKTESPMKTPRTNKTHSSGKLFFALSLLLSIASTGACVDHLIGTVKLKQGYNERSKLTTIKADAYLPIKEKNPHRYFLIFELVSFKERPDDGALLTIKTQDIAHQDCHNLELVIGENIIKPETEYRTTSIDTSYDPNNPSPIYYEYITTRLRAETVLEISNAHQVRGKLCNDEFELNEAQMAGLRAFVSEAGFQQSRAE